MESRSSDEMIAFTLRIGNKKSNVKVKNTVPEGILCNGPRFDENDVGCSSSVPLILFRKQK